MLDGAEACPEDPVVSTHLASFVLASRLTFACRSVRSQTGSAHCMLAPYYLDTNSAANQRLREAHPSLSTSHPVLRCQQGGPRRGSLEVEWRKDDGRVTLRGRAVTVMEGFLRI